MVKEYFLNKKLLIIKIYEEYKKYRDYLIKILRTTRLQKIKKILLGAQQCISSASCDKFEKKPVLSKIHQASPQLFSLQFLLFRLQSNIQ